MIIATCFYQNVRLSHDSTALRLFFLFAFASCRAESDKPISSPAPAALTPSAVASAEFDASPTTDASVQVATIDASVAPPSVPAGMLLVPAGAFTMGADTGGEDDEHPAHEVTLDAFYLDRTEVTNAAYQKCVDANVCRAPDEHLPSNAHAGLDEAFHKPEQPIVGVTWNDAKGYCEWRGARLPREAEFEKASRGTDERRFPWGNEMPTSEHAVCGRSFGRDATEAVGSHSKGRGPYGHDDLVGNVWEWCEDEYDPYAYRRPTAGKGVPGNCQEIMTTQNELRAQGRNGFTGSNPIPNECEHVIRGGAWNYDCPRIRSTNRIHHAARFRLVMLGFRCAKDGPK